MELVLLYTMFLMMGVGIFVSTKVYKKNINPVSIMLVFFLIWLILGRCGFNGQYKPTAESSIVLMFNMILMCVFVSIGSFSSIPSLKLPSIQKRSVQTKMLNLFRYGALIISIVILINLIRRVLTGGILLTQVRNISYSVAFNSNQYTAIYYNSVIYYLYQYIIRGFAFFDIAYGIVSLIHDKKRIKLISLLNFICFIIIMQSRIEIMKICVFALLALLLKGIKLTKQQKRYVKRIAIGMTIPIFAIFAVRTSSGSNVILHSIESFIVDYSGSNYMFSKYYADFTGGLRLSNYSWVHEFFGGFGTLFDYFKAIVGIPVGDNSALTAYLGVGTNIGSSTHYNTFYTAFMGFLDTGGYIGCIAFSALFGLLVGNQYKKYKKYGTVKKMYFSTLFLYIAVMSTYNYLAAGISSTILFLGTLLINDRQEDFNGENKKNRLDR